MSILYENKIKLQYQNYKTATCGKSKFAFFASSIMKHIDVSPA